MKLEIETWKDGMEYVFDDESQRDLFIDYFDILSDSQFLKSGKTSVSKDSRPSAFYEYSEEYAKYRELRNWCKNTYEFQGVFLSHDCFPSDWKEKEIEELERKESESPNFQRAVVLALMKSEFFEIDDLEYYYQYATGYEFYEYLEELECEES